MTQSADGSGASWYSLEGSNGLRDCPDAKVPPPTMKIPVRVYEERPRPDFMGGDDFVMIVVSYTQELGWSDSS